MPEDILWGVGGKRSR